MQDGFLPTMRVINWRVGDTSLQMRAGRAAPTVLAAVRAVLAAETAEEPAVAEDGEREDWLKPRRQDSRHEAHLEEVRYAASQEAVALVL